MLVEITEIHKMLIKKLQGPEKTLEALEEKRFFLASKIEALRNLLRLLDSKQNFYAKSVFLEIHGLELDLQILDDQIDLCNKDILRLMSHYQVLPVEQEFSTTLIIPIGVHHG